jgi:O-succinylbenzoate synthase
VGLGDLPSGWQSGVMSLDRFMIVAQLSSEILHYSAIFCEIPANRLIRLSWNSTWSGFVCQVLLELGKGLSAVRAGLQFGAGWVMKGNMRYQLDLRPYRRVFDRPMRWGSGVAEIREGCWIRLVDAGGLCGYGEVAPLEAFGTESLEASLSCLRSFCGVLSQSRIEALEHDAFPCTSHAILSALAGIELRRGEDAQGPDAGGGRVVSACLVGQAQGGDEPDWSVWKGRTIKLKIGDGGPEDALPAGRLKQWMERAAPFAVRFRLDANEGLDEGAFWRWMECLQPFAAAVDFVEQPMNRLWVDEMLDLQRQSPIPIAFDESLSVLRGQLASLAAEGVFWVLKPSLGDGFWVDPAVLRPDRVVVSSVFESAIGFSSVLAWSRKWAGMVPGLDTQRWFSGDDWHYPGEAAVFESAAVDLDDFWARVTRS